MILMPINRTGGNKSKKRKNTSDEPKSRKPEDIAKIPAQQEVYGRVLRAEGNRRFTVTCQQPDPEAPYNDINCQLKGSYKKTIKSGDFVLVQMWEFGEKGTVIDSYTPSEISRLDAKGMWNFKYKPSAAASASASASATSMPDEDDGVEFIGDNDAKERDIEKQNADERLGPAALSAVAARAGADEEFDIDAI